MTVETFDPGSAQAMKPLPVETPSRANGGFSRREMIKGVIASGAVVSAGTLLVGCGPNGETPVQAGGVERLISLNVNGKVRRVDVLPHETLANTLRYIKGLTGTKLGSSCLHNSLGLRNKDTTSS